MIDDSTPADPAAPPMDDRRRRIEAQREAATKRALELLATTRHYSAGPGVSVQGRWLGFRRPRGSAELRRRKRERWR